MQIGTVSKFFPDRGFGFIRPDDGGEELFVHITRCAEGVDDLREQQRVKFELRPSARIEGKFEAINVQPAS